MAERQPKEFRNIKMGTDAGKIKLTIDVSDYLNRNELPISSTGTSYLVASTFGNALIQAEGMEGLKISVNVFTAKQEYDLKMQQKQQQEAANAALAEINKSKEATQVMQNLGVNPELFAQFLAFQAQMQGQK